MSYEILKKRISDVEGFYEAILNQPFDFNVDENINLDYENLSYASNIDELRNLWRKRLKLSTLDAFASIREKLKKGVYKIASKGVEEEVN